MRQTEKFWTRSEKVKALWVWAGWFALCFVVVDRGRDDWWIPLLGAGVVFPWLLLGIGWLYVRRQESLRRRKTGLS